MLHQVLQLTLWNPADTQNKRKTNLHLVDLAVPVQSSDPAFTNLNTYLGQSLSSIATYLKEYFVSKSLGPQMQAELESNSLTKFLRRSLMGTEVNLIPLFFVNSQEDYKDESKSLLLFTQQ